ncbi:uncharacterized protein [Haliotis cracherodii]|uniref:uncharacterized protein n=1 Tax=Haliotis cracherodii TaxID=6455 RepID=UPI0039EB9695
MGARWTCVFLVVHLTSLLLMSEGQTCFFTETAGQKGSEMLRSDSANTTDVSACETLCNTTELCIAGEFLSTTNACHIYLVETNLTGQTETVFFQWNCTNETATTATTMTTTITPSTTMHPISTTPTFVSSSFGPQYRTEGAIASAVASYAVLLSIPCLMCIILSRKSRQQGRQREMDQ